MKKILSLALALAAALALAPAALAAGGGTAYASTQSVEVDGRQVEFQMYALKDASGNGTNYVKLRDVAHVLSGTPAQFAVGYDEASGAILVTAGQPYTDVGGEMTTPYSGDRAYQTAANAVLVDGQAADLEAISLTDDNGGGYTYFKLRDLGDALDFQVDWDPQRGVIVTTAKEPIPVVSEKPAGAIGGHYDTAVYYVPTDANKDGWITEAEVMAVFAQLEEEYPEGTPWDTKTRYPGLYEYTGGKYSGGMGASSACQGFANLVSDRIFGNLPKYEVSIDDIRPGDYFYSTSKDHDWICYTPYVIDDWDGKTYYNKYWSVDGNWEGSVVWRTVKFDSSWADSYGTGPSDKIWSRYPKE